ncbi:hypothetical protein [Massilia brevitalea]|uniref:hypothetical protein n=1 Tax=Massilia brevitalea TaxID=442526 RepID=UPI002738F906|nr:hypothetical protein [Massilia brevitalea]
MLIKKIAQGEILPRFYGVAWVDWYRDQAVCLPLGFNLLAACARGLFYSIKNAGRLVRVNPRDAYEQGRRDGRAEASRSLDIQPTKPWPR